MGRFLIFYMEKREGTERFWSVWLAEIDWNYLKFSRCDITYFNI